MLSGTIAGIGAGSISVGYWFLRKAKINNKLFNKIMKSDAQNFDYIPSIQELSVRK